MNPRHPRPQRGALPAELRPPRWTHSIEGGCRSAQRETGGESGGSRRLGKHAPVAQSGESSGLLIRRSQVRILPGARGVRWSRAVFGSRSIVTGRALGPKSGPRANQLRDRVLSCRAPSLRFSARRQLMTVMRRKNGWAFAASVADGARGRRQVWRGGFRTKAEAAAA